MRYKSYSSIIFAVVLVLFAASLYMFFTYGGRWYLAVVPVALVTIALLVLKSPIDRYFFKFQDVGFDDKIMGMIQMEYPVIADYPADKRKEFFQRLFYFSYDRECYMVAEETDELDLYHRLIILAPGVILSMEGSVDEARDVERIAAYKHPFPSPKMKFLHAAEYDEEDGVIIISLEQLMNSQHMPDQLFPVSYFLWAERKVAQQEGFPEVPKEFILEFQKIWGFSKRSAEDFIGYELRNQEAISICAYVLRKEQLFNLFPKFAGDIQSYMQA